MFELWQRFKFRFKKATAPLSSYTAAWCVWPKILQVIIYSERIPVQNRVSCDTPRLHLFQNTIYHTLSDMIISCKCRVFPHGPETHGHIVGFVCFSWDLLRRHPVQKWAKFLKSHIQKIPSQIQKLVMKVSDGEWNECLHRKNIFIFSPPSRGKRKQYIEGVAEHHLWFQRLHSG